MLIIGVVAYCVYRKRKQTLDTTNKNQQQQQQQNDTTLGHQDQNAVENENYYDHYEEEENYYDHYEDSIEMTEAKDEVPSYYVDGDQSEPNSPVVAYYADVDEDVY